MKYAKSTTVLITITVAAICLRVIIVIRATLLITLLCSLLRLLNWSPTHSSHLTCQRIFIRVGDVIIKGLIIKGRWILNFKLGIQSTRDQDWYQGVNTYCNIHWCIFSHESIAHNIYFPCKHSCIGRTLELNLVWAIIPVRVGLWIWHVRNLEWGHHDSIGFFICEYNPPRRFSLLENNSISYKAEHKNALTAGQCGAWAK